MYSCSAANTGSPDHHAELHCIFPSGHRMEAIKAETATTQHSRFSCKQYATDDVGPELRQLLWEPWGVAGHSKPVQSSCQKEQTSGHILHRLTASPDSASACLTLSSSDTASHNKLQELAHNWYSILTSTDGFLVLRMKMTPDPSHGVHGTPSITPRYHELRVLHWGQEWTINGNSHKTAPASLVLGVLPSSLCAVEAQLYSTTSTGSCFLTKFNCLDPGMNRNAWKILHVLSYNNRLTT